ncbi:MAG: DUF922 domain-containing protein [Chloroflexota bacterium]|nr:DUF922 domain-containing protein [Chloroflexota bacterium]
MQRLIAALGIALVLALVLPILVTASTTYLQPYHVPGNTLAEAKAYMDQHGPTDKDGDHYPGMTYIDAVPNKHQGVPVVKPIQEPLYQATITITVTWSIAAQILLPTWDGYGQASDAAKAEWDRYVAALKDHEDGHVQVAEDTLANMSPPPQTTFTATGTGTTPEDAIANAHANMVNVDQQIEQERQRILNKIDQASDQYDKGTDHGTTQGATLNTNVTSGTPEERIGGLIDDVDLSSASEGINNALKSKLNNALKSLEKGNERSAVSQLNAFIRQLEATADKPNGPTMEEARGLANVAQSIRGQIRGD